jgi:murein DD-endopeptidase MepM/ murein hydrolase activator NlpD
MSGKKSIKKFIKLFVAFLAFFFSYLKKRILSFSHHFEKNKNRLVKFFLMKRGRYNRPFLHLTTMAVLGIGVLIAPFIADTYPIFASPDASALQVAAPQTQQSIIIGENVFQTDVSEKPRDEIITYRVQGGDTVSTIAKKFGIDTDTVRWANNLSSDNLTVGDELQILPVPGVAHKVASGDTVYTIAKRYDTEAQKIVDFPFNDFANPETFALVQGDILIVPDGIKPSERPSSPRRQQSYVAQGPATAISPGGYTWPVRGGVSQFASWYHMALDITADVGTPVVAAQNGTVTKINVGSWDGGYGTNLYIDNGAGGGSHYAHLSGVNVGIGQQVVAGRTVVGWVGMTGRTTGPHLHFEILRGGSLVNPMSYLQ